MNDSLKHKLSQMTPPCDLQSYNSASLIAATTEQKDEETSRWKEIEEEDDNMLVNLSPLLAELLADREPAST